MSLFRIALANARFHAAPEESVALAEEAIAQAGSAGAGSPTTSAVVRPDGTLLCYQPYGKEGCSSRTSI